MKGGGAEASRQTKIKSKKILYEKMPEKHLGEGHAVQIWKRSFLKATLRFKCCSFEIFGVFKCKLNVNFKYFGGQHFT